MYKILLSILLFSTVALAHEEKPSYYDDDGNLVVTLHIHGLRTASDHQHKTYSYDIIGPENLNESTSLNIVTSGPKNQLSSTFTRGTDSDHTLITLNGIGEKGSKGSLKMHNAKILPKELVGTGQKILGYNDLYKGYMFIDYDDDTIYINQTKY